MCSCHVVYRVNQAEYVIRTLLAALQKYMDTYSTHRVFKLSGVLLPYEACADVRRYPGQGQPGGIRHSYSCGCASEVAGYLFNTSGLQAEWSTSSL